MTTQYLPFATGGSANTYSYAAYASSAEQSVGYVNGVADAQHVNTALRQASVAAAAVAKLAADYGTHDVLDNGNVADFESALKSALDAIVGAEQFWAPGDVKATIVDAEPAGWLRANGQVVSRATYAALFAAIGTAYGAGDGSTTFQLPDYRGRVPRGWSNGSTLDSGRAIGSLQDDQVPAHVHPLSDNILTEGVAGSGPGGTTSGNSGVPVATGSYGAGTEVRVHNFAALILIKA